MRERNYGIDALRIVAMFYIVILHVLGKGGVLDHPELNGLPYKTAWFLEILSYCAVNCFALVSGYVGYREDSFRFRLSHYLNLWFQVVFYCLLVTLVFDLVKTELVSWKDYIKVFLPVSLDRFWYFTAYTPLFFIMPLINLCISKLEKSTLRLYIILFILLFSCFSTACGVPSQEYADPFYLQDGYSFLWLAVLYFLGAAMKKSGMFMNISPGKSLFMILLLVVFTEVWKIYSWMFLVPVLGNSSAQDMFICYTSPTILLISILHVSVFAQLTISPAVRKFLSFAAPGAFAVYLLNVHPLVWHQFMDDRFVFLGSASTLKIVSVTLAFSLCFVLGSLMIDYLRRILFRCARIHILSLRIEQTVDGWINRLSPDSSVK